MYKKLINKYLPKNDKSELIHELYKTPQHEDKFAMPHYIKTWFPANV